MAGAPWFELVHAPDGAVLKLAGAWRMAHLAEIEAALAALALPEGTRVDGSALAGIDSAAALVLLRALRGPGAPAPVTGLAPAHARVLERVREHLAADGVAPEATAPGPLEHVGRAAAYVARLLHGHLNFLGAMLVAFAELLRRPGRLRWRELTVQIEQTGLNALPVVALVTLLIGVVIAYLLGLQASKYGANIFVVDGVGIGATREFAPIIVAVIVAGRSGAAFTAQLGAMRLTEETDAIRTLGLSPAQVLVLPRVLALAISLPLLVFVGDVMSLVGAMAIAQTMLDLTPSVFLARLREALDLRHVVIGLVKAPVFALAIALVGTRMGMTVERDTRAVGAATTSTVVQSIVAVIVLDAVFAVILQAMGL